MRHNLVGFETKMFHYFVLRCHRLQQICIYLSRLALTEERAFDIPHFAKSNNIQSQHYLLDVEDVTHKVAFIRRTRHYKTELNWTERSSVCIYWICSYFVFLTVFDFSRETLSIPCRFTLFQFIWFADSNNIYSVLRFLFFVTIFLWNHILRRIARRSWRQYPKFSQNPTNSIGRLCSHRQPILQTIRL